MFRRATGKLEDATVHIRQMREASNVIDFKAAFAATLADLRTFMDVLGQDAPGAPGYGKWFRATRDALDAEKETGREDLLKWLETAGDDSIHEGETGLVSKGWTINVVGDLEYKNKPGTVLHIGASGPVVYEGMGTAQARRTPLSHPALHTTIQLTVKNPPATHNAQPLKNDDPVSLCETALLFYQGLLFEAVKKFPTRRSPSAP